LSNQIRDSDAELIEMREMLLKDQQFAQTVTGTVIAGCAENPVEIANKFREYLGIFLLLFFFADAFFRINAANAGVVGKTSSFGSFPQHSTICGRFPIGFRFAVFPD
jgi:hypothetical protein